MVTLSNHVKHSSLSIWSSSSFAIIILNSIVDDHLTIKDVVWIFPWLVPWSEPKSSVYIDLGSLHATSQVFLVAFWHVQHNLSRMTTTRINRFSPKTQLIAIYIYIYIAIICQNPHKSPKNSKHVQKLLASNKRHQQKWYKSWPVKGPQGGRGEGQGEGPGGGGPGAVPIQGLRAGFLGSHMLSENVMKCM